MGRIRNWCSGSWLAAVVPLGQAFAQIDPTPRDIVHAGYEKSLVGYDPTAAYLFYYRNAPGFLGNTNLTLRTALAAPYLDAELGIHNGLGEHTDVGIGLAGGGLADSYIYVNQGNYVPEESFLGHLGEMSVSLYHRFNPAQQIPLNLVLRASGRYTAYGDGPGTASDFEVPGDLWTGRLRAGLRWGGKEPVLFPQLAMECSIWYEGIVRNRTETYGYSGESRVNPQTHQFWARELLYYTPPGSGHVFGMSLLAGININADQLSAFRLGGDLPMIGEFPALLPGYYFQELSATRYLSWNASYLMPLDSRSRWNLTFGGSTALVDYLDGFSQPTAFNSGISGGLTYGAPTDSLRVAVGYGYGFQAIRSNGRGGQSINILCQFDWGRYKSAPMPDAVQPGTARGLFQLFAH